MKSYENRTNTAFTGHRQISNPEQIRLKVRETSLSLIERGVTRFFVGAAIGFDCLAGDEILKIRQDKPEINLIIVLPCPFENLTRFWSAEQKQILDGLMKATQEIITIQNFYSSDCYKKRNQYLVDNSRFCVCYYNENKTMSGTAQTVRMAEKWGLEIINLF